MSSDYKLICVSHDPGLVISPEWSSASGGRDIAFAAVRDPASYPGVDEHERCDLLILRYSGALMEVACPGHDRPIRHVDADWVETPWLRLLWLAHQEPAGSPLKDAALDYRLAPCWTFERVHRLRGVLGIDGDR